MQEEHKRDILDKTFVKICQKLKAYDKELNENFIKLSTNFDRFRFIWSLGFVHTELNAIFESKSLKYEAKNLAKACEHRRLGNEHFIGKRYYASLLSYNESIRFAPRHSDDNDLALAYANRSAAYFYSNEYNLCLSDIERAFKFGYPKKLRPKLIERKLNCLVRLELFHEALDFVKLEGDTNMESGFKEKLKDLKEQIVRE